METQLAKELKKYYTREGNKIIFRNGMTLNKLAQELWEKRGFHEIDASVVSKVINSKRTFSVKQLEAFCEVIGLPLDEQQSLYNALYRDQAAKNPEEVCYAISPSDIVDFVHLHLDIFYQMRVHGNPQLAITSSHDVLNKIRQMFLKVNTTILQSSLQKAYALLLYEVGMAYKEVTLPNRLCETVRPLIEQLHTIVTVSKDQELAALFNLYMGDMHYILSDYNTSISYLKQSWNEQQIKNVRDQLLLLRVLALDYAYLNNSEQFRTLQLDAQGLMERSKEDVPEEVCRTIEGIARGQGLLHLPEAHTTLEEGWNIHKTLEHEVGKVPLRAIQLTRTELEIAQYFREDKQTIEQHGNKGIALAQEYGYQRYVSHIRTLMEVSLAG